MVQSITVLGMDVYSSADRAQVKRMEIVRKIFKKRDSAEMSIESNMQSDDEMSLDQSGSGSFARPIPKPIVQKKVSNYFISEHGCSPPKRESSLERLVLQEQEKK